MSEYFSFLICRHPDHVDFFLNGRPIGVLKDDVFNPYQFTNPDGTKREMVFEELPKPHPFTSAEDYRDFMLSQVGLFVENIDDGLGSAWPKRCCQCGRKAMFVVRPGKAECGFCG